MILSKIIIDWRYVPAVLLGTLVTALAFLFLAMSVPNGNIVRNILRSSSLHHDGSWLYFTPLEYSTRNVRTPLTDIECTILAFGLRGNQDGFTNILGSVIEAPTVPNCNSLEELLAGNSTPLNYHRYWHGYAVLTRPLLNFFAYSTLRLISALGLLVLCVGAFLCFMRKGGVGAAFGLIFPLLFINPQAVTMLCFVPVWTVASIGVIAVTVAIKGQKSALRYVNIFVLIGSLTSFVDLLTNPIATFCVPATALMWLNSSEKRIDSQKCHLLFLFQVGAAWCVGYFGFWCLKFGLVFLRDGTSSIREIIDVAIYRLHGPVAESMLMIGSATVKNFSAVATTMIVISSAIAATIIMHPMPETILSAVRKNSAMLAICPAPVVWYELFANHSYIHWIFTSWNSYLIFLPITVMVLGSWPSPLRTLR